MPNTKNYIVYIQEDFLRDTQVAPNADADYTDDWNDIDGSLIVGCYIATSKQEAIAYGAADAEVEKTMLGVFEIKGIGL